MANPNAAGAMPAGRLADRGHTYLPAPSSERPPAACMASSRRSPTATGLLVARSSLRLLRCPTWPCPGVAGVRARAVTGAMRALIDESPCISRRRTTLRTAMFRELDQRHSHHLTVTLEWDPDTDDVWIRCEDHRSPEESFTFWVEPGDARHAFLHPFAACPVNRDHAESTGRVASGGEVRPTRRRRRWRGRGRGTPAEQPDGDRWSWWTL